MRPISPQYRKRIGDDDYYRHCARGDSDCSGRVEIEHANYYQGRQIDEMWNFIPLCTEHHRGGHLNKEFNQYLSLKRATLEDFKKYPRFNWLQRLTYLEKKYGRK